MKTFSSMVLRCAFTLALVLATAAANAVCVESKPLCVDGPGSKFIDGVEVFRECWNYQITKECNSEETVDYCSGLKNTPSCTLISNTCTAATMSGECVKTDSVYRCSEKAADEAHIEEINVSHTVIDRDDAAQCASFLDNPDCFIAEEKCVEGPATKIINGVSVYKDCWKKELSYACSSAGVLNSCNTLDKAGCKPMGEPVCIREEASSCRQYQSQYVCVNKDPIEGEGITPEGEPSKPGFDMASCQEATAGKSCKVLKSECDYNDEGDCVRTHYIYECVETVNQNQCSPLEASSECVQKKSTCIERDGLKCIAYKKEILCRGESEIEAPGAEVLDKNIAIGSVTWSDACLPVQENPSCEITGSKCVESGDKVVGGELVSKDCWKYEHTYVCTGVAGSPGEPSGPTKNDCDKLEANKKCVRVDSSCIAVDVEGKCLTTAHTYRCEEKEGSTTTETFCRPVECLDGLCEGSQDEADKEFSKVIALLEAARQGAVYGDIDGNQFFKGAPDACSKKVLGFSCCDTKVQAGNSNASAFGKVMEFAGEATWEAIKYVGSPYVYDVLSATDATAGMLNFLYGNAASGVYNPSLSFYGFGMTMQSGTMYFTFDPYSFALSVAVQIAMEYLQCEPAEQTLMLKKGQNLCHYVGTYCSKGETFGCIERKESYCCYNSPLSRIINEQGRPQLGKSWGSAKSPDCSGFTQEELEKLDFDAMDLSEFEALITQKQEVNIEAAKDRGEHHVGNLTDKNLGGYVDPATGNSAVANPDFVGTPVAKPSRKNSKNHGRAVSKVNRAASKAKTRAIKAKR